jgi:hypothetical protein
MDVPPLILVDRHVRLDTIAEETASPIQGNINRIRRPANYLSNFAGPPPFFVSQCNNSPSFRRELFDALGQDVNAGVGGHRRLGRTYRVDGFWRQANEFSLAEGLKHLVSRNGTGPRQEIRAGSKISSVLRHREECFLKHVLRTTPVGNQCMDKYMQGRLELNEQPLNERHAFQWITSFFRHAMQFGQSGSGSELAEVHSFGTIGLATQR